MKILICIKQVPDMESKFKINGEGNWYDRADLAWRMNEYDEYAVEQAVRLKEQVKEADLTVLCIGPDQVKETMKKALAMGCDRGVHIADADSYKREPIEIASMIAGFAKDKNFDIIFTGMQSQDRGSAQVGVMVAELLGIPAVTTIVGFAYRQRHNQRQARTGRRQQGPGHSHHPGGAHLSTRPEHPALPDPAQHHEGQEKRAADHGSRRRWHRSPPGDGGLLFSGEKGRRHCA